VDEAAAKRLVGAFWRPEEWRFVEPRSDGWMPPADRFPRKETP
jgi:hypothetical protein